MRLVLELRVAGAWGDGLALSSIDLRKDPARGAGRVMVGPPDLAHLNWGLVMKVGYSGGLPARDYPTAPACLKATFCEGHGLARGSVMFAVHGPFGRDMGDARGVLHNARGRALNIPCLSRVAYLGMGQN